MKSISPLPWTNPFTFLNNDTPRILNHLPLTRIHLLRRRQIELLRIPRRHRLGHLDWLQEILRAQKERIDVLERAVARLGEQEVDEGQSAEVRADVDKVVFPADCFEGCRGYLSDLGEGVSVREEGREG